jgi:hypothetical protein
MSREDEYISLREASEMTGYTADYIGQLIRGGKLPGKQVFSNVAWMTTREALLEYINNKDKKTEAPSLMTRLKERLVAPETLVKVYTVVAWGVIALLAAATLFIAYVFAVSLDNRIAAESVERLNHERIR